MLALDFVVVFGSVFLGAVCAVFVNRFSKTKKENKINASKGIKSEFNNLVFERDVALEALGKVDQFFSEKKIDSFEKDRLLLKYGRLLEHYDERIFKMQPSVEIQDMYQYRNQIYSLMSNSVAKLDKKLDSFSDKFGYFKEGGNNGNKPYFDSAPSVPQKTKPADRKPDAAATAKNDKDKDNNSDSKTDSMASMLSKSSHNGFGSSGPGENPPMVSPNSLKNDDDAAADGSNTKREELSLDVEDIDKIQQDILKILKRLENPTG